MSTPDLSNRRSGVERRARRLWHKWKVSIAFLWIALAFFFGLMRLEHLNSSLGKSTKGFKTLTQQVVTQIADSGTSISILGCNRDFRTNQTLRGILERQRSNATRQYNEGLLGADQYKNLREIYKQNIKQIKFPDCRLKIIVSPTTPIKIGIPLYKGSYYEFRPLPGEIAIPTTKAP